MPFTVAQIAEHLDAKVVGDESLIVDAVGEIEDGQKQRTIVLAINPAAVKKIQELPPKIVVLSEDLPELNATKLITGKGKEVLVDLLNLFFPEDHTGFISPQADIHDSTEIGINVKIYPGVFIGEAVKIGDNTTIYPNVVIYDHTLIGNNVIIHANTTIGSDGFGYIQKEGKNIKVPQKGNVVIEDDVEIGAGCTIDRATISSTIVGAGTKIDNKVHIAHNCKIGRNCLLAGASNLSGSVKLEDNVILGGGAGVADGITIGRGSIVAACTAAMRDFPAGSFIYATPAGEDYKQAIKCRAVYNKLPELQKKVKELEKKVNEG